MFKWVKKQVAKIYINHQLKKLGVKEEYRATISACGADVYIIYMLVTKLLDKHREPIAQIFKDTTAKVDIDKVLNKIQEGWKTDEHSNNIK